jgi:GWxTD domain-containing protein
MGLAEYGVGDSQVALVAGIQAMLGKDAMSRSAMAFAKSAEVDPGFVHGLVDLASTALRQRINIKLNVALDALRRAASTPAGHNPAVLLARGRVEREVGDADSALAAFRAYTASNADPSLGDLEIARTLFLRGSYDGVAPYYAGAASDDSTTVAQYRHDLALIAPDTALATFDKLHGKARVAWLHQFWHSRDEKDLRDPGDRLREHHRRIFYARRNFALASLHRHYDIVERYRSGSKEFDDRGIIYIRQGAPTERATYAAPGVEPNESWRYSRPDGDLLFHFVAREDVQDFKLVESALDVLGFSNTVMLRGGNEDGSLSDTVGYRAQQLLTTREPLSPIYRRIQAAGPASQSQYQARERQIGRRSIKIGTTTDSHELEFLRQLDARIGVLAVGHDSAGPMLQLTYALSGRTLEPVQVSQGYLYTVRLRFVALDSFDRVVATMDTTRRFLAAAPVPKDQHLVGRVAVSVPHGTLHYRMALQESADAGVVLPTDTVEVDQGRRGLALSDLVLGARPIHLSWAQANGDTVYFNPLDSFTPDENLELYYEVYGLPAGTAYQTQLSVKKKGGGGFLGLFGGGTAISLTSSEHATADLVRVQRSLDLKRLKPGSYTLEVKVSARGYPTMKQKQEFQVTQPRS